MIIIGIAGGTGSGKTTVVRKIIESLPPGSVAVIPQDSYYNDQSSIPLEIRKPISTIPMLLTGRSLNNRLPTCAKGIPLSSPPILI